MHFVLHLVLLALPFAQCQPTPPETANSKFILAFESALLHSTHPSDHIFVKRSIETFKPLSLACFKNHIDALPGRKVNVIALQSNLASEWMSLPARVRVQKRGPGQLAAALAEEILAKEGSEFMASNGVIQHVKTVSVHHGDKVTLHFFGDGTSQPADQGLQPYPDFTKISNLLTTELDQAMSETRLRLDIDVFKTKRKAIGSSEKDPVWFTRPPTRMVHHVLDQLVWKRLSSLSVQDMNAFRLKEGEYRVALGRQLIKTLTQVDGQLLDSIMADYKEKWYNVERERQKTYNQPHSGLSFDSHYDMVWNYGYKFRRDAVERRILQLVWYTMDHPDPTKRRLLNYKPEALIKFANRAIAQDLRPDNPPSIFLDDPTLLIELTELLQGPLDEGLARHRDREQVTRQTESGAKDVVNPDPVDSQHQVGALGPDSTEGQLPKDTPHQTTTVTKTPLKLKTRLVQWTHKNRLLVRLGAALILSASFVGILTGILYGPGES